MSWKALNPVRHLGKAVGSGQCVAFVAATAGTPPTAQWLAGDSVTGNDIEPGTAIATFDPDGTYGNHLDGRSHAAIYIQPLAGGIEVWDQWLGQPVHKRTIQARNGRGLAVDDADAYSVIERA